MQVNTLLVITIIAISNLQHLNCRYAIFLTCIQSTYYLGMHNSPHMVCLILELAIRTGFHTETAVVIFIIFICYTVQVYIRPPLRLLFFFFFLKLHDVTKLLTESPPNTVNNKINIIKKIGSKWLGSSNNNTICLPVENDKRDG
jgi:hypothetical protein